MSDWIDMHEVWRSPDSRSMVCLFWAPFEYPIGAAGLAFYFGDGPAT